MEETIKNVILFILNNPIWVLVAATIGILLLLDSRTRESLEIQHLQLMATYRLLQSNDLEISGRFYESAEMKNYMYKFIRKRSRT